jgi:predicted metal-dependent hydrolase
LSFSTRQKAQFLTVKGILARMSVQIDEFIRAKRRTISIQVRPDGKVIVRAPLRVAEKIVRAFVESKADWIARKKAEVAVRAPVTVREFRDGERFLLLGREIPLKVATGQRAALTLTDAFILSAKALPNAGNVFEKWYKAYALQVLTERVKLYAARHGFQPARIRITSARTRWGSCSSNGTLSFTWRLVMAPLDVVDYVVIHELVHLRVHNHSKDFWDGVAELMPDYKRHIAWLKSNGGLMTWFS